MKKLLIALTLFSLPAFAGTQYNYTFCVNKADQGTFQFYYANEMANLCDRGSFLYRKNAFRVYEATESSCVIRGTRGQGTLTCTRNMTELEIGKVVAEGNFRDKRGSLKSFKQKYLNSQFTAADWKAEVDAREDEAQAAD